jgi:ABC-2 type transport system ATP-binding protein
MPRENIIEVDNLSHRFGAVVALDGMSYSVEWGEVFGFLGPNGAGKTTSVRLLNGVLAPSGGCMHVLGFDPARQGCELRRNTGVLTETPSLYERLTARDNLMTIGALYGIPEKTLPGRVDQALEQFGLSERADDKTGGFSKGMKQRLALARSLLNDPQLLFLDEPTAALDPQAAHQVTELIANLSHKEGRTVFLCTHNLDEAERLCDRVAVVNKGRLLAVGTPAELANQLWRSHWVDVTLAEPMPGVTRLSAVPGVVAVEAGALTLAVQIDSLARVPDVVFALSAWGGRIQVVQPRRHSLEDIYFEIQNHPEN